MNEKSIPTKFNDAVGVQPLPYIVRQEEFRKRLGISKATMHAWKKSGRLPQAAAIGGARAVGYLSTAVDAFIAALFATVKVAA